MAACRRLSHFSLEELTELDETWWANCEKLAINFRHADNDGRAHLTFERPLNPWQSAKTTAYISGSDYGSSLAAENEFVQFISANTAGYGILSWRGLWVCLSLIPWSIAARWLVFHGTAIPRQIDQALTTLQIVALFMYFIGARAVFPKVQFALGTGARKNTRHRDRAAKDRLRAVESRGRCRVWSLGNTAFWQVKSVTILASLHQPT